MVVMRAARHLPRHRCTSTQEAGTESNRFNTRDKVGSTKLRNMGPPESAINASPCRDHTYNGSLGVRCGFRMGLEWGVYSGLKLRNLGPPQSAIKAIQCKVYT